MPDLNDLTGNETTFGFELWKARKRKHISQGDLGRCVNVSNATVSNWERGIYQPSAPEVFLLEYTLDLVPGTLSRLLGYIPLNEGTQLALDLVRLLGTPTGLRVLRGLVARHSEPNADLGLAG